MLMIFTLCLLLAMILIKLNSAISIKTMSEREKGSPFECGYDPKSMARLPFSMHFYLLAVIFLIFDIEITIIMPMPILMNKMNLWLWLIMTMTFMMILIVGAIHEWKEGSLEWIK